MDNIDSNGSLAIGLFFVCFWLKLVQQGTELQKGHNQNTITMIKP